MHLKVFRVFAKLSSSATNSWFKIFQAKQSLRTLREAGTKEGRWATNGPLILQGGTLKEFKTIAEHIRILETRGMRVGEEASTILLRENYYAIINGCKDSFLDKEAMQSSAEDVYLKGARSEWLYSLFKFDRELRQITFSCLIQAEAALKTATVYAFCEKHPNCSDYLDRSSFCSARDMLMPKTFKGNKMAQHSKSINKLMGILNKKLVVGPATRPFVEHYIAAYGEVPLWVLSNDLTFGNTSHFFPAYEEGRPELSLQALVHYNAPNKERWENHPA